MVVMFAKTLKTLRKENDTTQCELAEKLGVKQSTVSSWEIGVPAPLSSSSLKFRTFSEPRQITCSASRTEKTTSFIPTARPCKSFMRTSANFPKPNKTLSSKPFTLTLKQSNRKTARCSYAIYGRFFATKRLIPLIINKLQCFCAITGKQGHPKLPG